MMRRVWIVLFVLSLISGISYSGVYYVAPKATAELNMADEGEAAWQAAQDINHPCSAQTAMARAVAGDTVYFRGGTYRLEYDLDTHDESHYWYYAGALNPSNSGEEGCPIVFKAYPGELPVMDTEYQYSQHTYDGCKAFGLACSNYITFDGFKIQSGNGERMGVMTIAGNECNPDELHDVEVKNCIFDGGTRVVTSTDNREGLRIEHIRNVLVKGCTFCNYVQENNWHNTSGIKMYHTSNIRVENCEFYNNTLAIFDKSDSNGNIYKNNYLHDNHSGIVFTGFAWTGFVSAHRNIVISNNLFVNGGEIGDGEQEWSDSDNMRIYNNTMYADEENHYVGMDFGAKRKYVYNNICYGPIRDYDIGILRFITGRTEEGYYYPLEIVACDHNQFGDIENTFCIRTIGPNADHSGLDWSSYNTFWSLSAWQSSGALMDGSNPGEGSLASDPRFANFSGTMSEIRDFMLASNSPCKGAGRNGKDIGANVLLVGPSPIADINGDKEVTILDVQRIVNAVLGTAGSEGADINYDGSVTIVDVQLEANAILR